MYISENWHFVDYDVFMLYFISLCAWVSFDFHLNKATQNVCLD